MEGGTTDWKWGMDAMFAGFFSFSFQEIALSSCWGFSGDVIMKTAIKHPQAPQKMMIVAMAEIIIYRGAQWRGCGNRTATWSRELQLARDETQNEGVRAWNGGGENKRQPLAFLDLGRSDVFTERRQPRWLCEGATAEKIKGDRHDTAGMQWNGACGVKRNEAVLWM